jgi:myosin heavy subunit
MANKLVVKGEGVPDFVLMDQLTEDAMYSNMQIRFPIDRIYTYIGSVVVSVCIFQHFLHLFYLIFIFLSLKM